MKLLQVFVLFKQVIFYGVFIVVWVLLWLVFLETDLIGGQPETGSYSRIRRTNIPRWLAFSGNIFIGESTLVDLGLDCRDEGQLHDAIDCFTKAIGRNPNDARYFKWRGDCHWEDGNLNDALRDYRHAVNIDPNQENLITLGRALHNSRLFNEAVNILVRAGAVQELAMLESDLWARGEFTEAIRCLDKIIENHPEAQFYAKRGKYHLDRRSFSSAISDYREVLQREPQNNDAKLALSTALMGFGNHKEAADVIITSFNANHIAQVGNLLTSKNYHEHAARCYSELIRRDPSALEYYKLRAVCFTKSRNWEQAINDLEILLSMEQNNRDLRLQLVKVLFEAGKYPRAVEELLFLNDIDEIKRLGELLVRRRLYNEAITFYNIAIDRNPYEERFLQLRGELYEEMRRPSMALLDFHRLVLLQPQNRSYRVLLKRALQHYGTIDNFGEECIALLNVDDVINLGIDFFRLKNFRAALPCFNNAISRGPQDIELIRKRAMCYLENGEYEMAIIELVGLLQVNPQNQHDGAALIRALSHFAGFSEIPDTTLEVLNDRNLSTLGSNLHSAGRFEDAIRCFTAAISKNSSNAQYFKQRGECYLRARNPELAIRDFRQVAQVNPYDKENQAALSQALFNSQNFLENIECLSVLTDPTLAKLGDDFYSAQKFEEALLCYNETLRKFPGEVEYYRRRGLCYWKMQNLDEAIVDLNKTVEIKPSSIKYRMDLIELLSQAERYEDILKIIGNANENDLQGRDKALIEKISKKIEEVMKRRESGFLLNYAKQLINEDADRQIQQVNEESLLGGLDLESQSKINIIESNRNNYLEELELAFKSYKNMTYGRIKPSESLEIPSYLCDGVSYDLIEDPFVTPMGVTYDLNTIRESLGHFDFDPMNRDPIREADLRPNLALKAAIELWRLQNLG